MQQLVVESMNHIRLRDDKRLFLTKGGGWKDAHFDIILPLLEGRIPPAAERISSSNNSRVWKVRMDGASFFIKFFAPRGIRDKLLFRKTRARRASEGSLILLQNGFLSPAILVQGDVVKGWEVGESFLVTEEVEKGYNIYSFVETFFNQSEFEAKRICIKTFGTVIGRLHKKGIFHGDLRPGNILIKNTGSAPDVYFLDNERNKYFESGIPDRLREKNLVQLNMIVTPKITFTDRLRFFHAYLAENPELKPSARVWIRGVFLKTRKRLQRKILGIWKKTVNGIIPLDIDRIFIL